MLKGERMLKKFIAFVTAVSAAAALIPAVFAADDTVTGYSTENTVYTEYNDEDSNTAVLSFYDNGILSYSTMAEYDDSSYIFNVPREYQDDDARICYIGGNIYDMTIEADTAPEQTEAPNATEEPSATEPAPTATAAATSTAPPQNTPYPSAYPSEHDANNAPAIVTGLSVTEIDGEYYDVLTMLYAGNEVTVNVRDTVSIVSAPDAVSDIAGSGTSALKEGDVIHFTTDLQGRIKSIELIYRPDFDDYIGEGADFGNNFEELISASGVVANQSGWRVASYGGNIGSGYLYAFGVPIEAGQSSLTLANADGTRMDIDVNPEAMVYTVNGSSRSDKVEFAGNGARAVTRNYISSGNYDDEGNVISWDDVDIMTYALVRIIDGEATDIIVFEL